MTGIFVLQKQKIIVALPDLGVLTNAGCADPGLLPTIPCQTWTPLTALGCPPHLFYLNIYLTPQPNQPTDLSLITFSITHRTVP